MKKIILSILSILSIASFAFAANHPITVLMTNYAGANMTKGMLVNVYDNNATNATEGFFSAGGNATQVFGVLGSNCTNGTACWVCIGGIADVLLESTGEAWNSTAVPGNHVYAGPGNGTARGNQTWAASFYESNCTIGTAVEAQNGTGHYVKTLIRIHHNQ